MRRDWNFVLPGGRGFGRAIVATGLIAASLLLSGAAAHADVSPTIAVGAGTGPFDGYNNGEQYGSSTDTHGSIEPVDTGLKVTASTTSIQITYISGTITIAGTGSAQFTPDGISTEPGRPFPSGHPSDDARATHVPLASANYAQLLYRIGPKGNAIGTVFARGVTPGTLMSITPPKGASGELYLFINDTQYYDNAGAYTVVVGLINTSSTDTGNGIHADGTSTPEAPAGLLLAIGMLPLAGMAAWRRKRAQGSRLGA